MYADDDLIPISALQHFLFCERQCALIHIEQTWADNVFTIQGQLLHKRVHSGKSQRRPEKRSEFGMAIRSLELGLTGMTDAVEYRADGGVVVVEYKRGRPKEGLADEVQLCAQALCLEEMRGMHIAEGALYYGKTRRRKAVVFDESLREHTRRTVAHLREFLQERRTPSPVYGTGKCPRCSLRALCLPGKLERPQPVDRYMSRMLRPEDET